MDRRAGMKLGDWAIIAAAALLSVCGFFLLPRGGGTVTVTVNGQAVYSGPVSRDARIVTPDGKNMIIVKDGRAYMQHANCADKLCIRMGEAHASRPVVCLPNRVAILITGNDGEADAVTY